MKSASFVRKHGDTNIPNKVSKIGQSLHHIPQPVLYIRCKCFSGIIISPNEVVEKSANFQNILRRTIKSWWFFSDWGISDGRADGTIQDLAKMLILKRFIWRNRGVRLTKFWLLLAVISSQTYEFFQFPIQELQNLWNEKNWWEKLIISMFEILFSDNNIIPNHF